MKTVRQESGCALYQGSACMYDLSLLALARGVGWGFMPGLEAAVDEADDL